MTTFTAPLIVKSPWLTDTTVATVDASTALFIASPQTGPNANTIGTLLITQAVTVTNLTSGASTIRLPASSRIAEMVLVVLVSGSGNSQGVNVRIGTSGDATFFGTIKGSAPNIYRGGVAPNAAAVSAANFRIGASDTQLHLDVSGVTTAAGAVDNFEGIFYVTYLR